MRSLENDDHYGSRKENEQLAEMLGESFSFYGRLQNWSLNRICDSLAPVEKHEEHLWVKGT